MNRLPEIANQSNHLSSRAVFSSVFATLGTLFTWLFGEWDLIFKVLASFMLIDYITGVLVAYIESEIDSKKGFKGIVKKVLMLILLTVGVLLDRLIGSEWTFRTAVCYFLIGNEGWSIVENIGKTGVKIPNKLKRALTQLMDEKNIEDEK